MFVYNAIENPGLPLDPDSSLSDRPGRSGDDLFGIGILGGDITGNGAIDVAISAPNEEFSNGLRETVFELEIVRGAAMLVLSLCTLGTR